MRKLFITCDCGQQMQVPRSAIGKMGQCPACGEKIPINRDTTSRTPQARASVGSTARARWGEKTKPSLDAKQRFGRAVDLYCAGHYGEALAIFNALQIEFPDSLEIERARQQCIDARNRDPIHLPGPGDGQVAGDEIDETTLRALRRIAVEKMLHGATDAVQIQAAELVARIAGVYHGGGAPNSGTAPQNGHANANGNGRGVHGDTPAAKSNVELQSDSDL